jgi:putative ABC transport system permease protein
MSLWFIAWRYLWSRKLTTGLTILSVALAVGLISAVLTLRSETERRFEEEGQAFDFVIGANGSPLQLVLSSVYFMDSPIGNIPYEAYEKIKADTEYVTAAFPIGMGDSYRSFRIVGTTPELFQHKWIHPYTKAERTPFKLAQGSIFTAPMQAVLGARVAMDTGLKIGDTFISAHGLIDLPEAMQTVSHAETPYTVVGILAPSNSPFDRAIYCSLDSVWHAHADHDDGYGDDDHDHQHEVTAVLVQLDSPALRFQYRERLKLYGNVNGTVPIDEISKLFQQVLEPAKTVMLAVGYLVVVISAISILIGLYLSIIQRKRDLAVMRALGASAVEIFGIVLVEAFLVTLLGIAAGWFVGQAVTYTLGIALARNYGLLISAFQISSEQISAFATVALVGLVAGILPAWQAYDRDVAADLAEK